MLVQGRTSPAVSGRLEPRQALERLLAGSGLVALQEGQAFVVRAAPAPGAAATLEPITVMADAERESATGPVPGYVARRSATGTKTDTPIIETPQSISVVGAEEI
jgi:iron complex outermembrane receptor protein